MTLAQILIGVAVAFIALMGWLLWRSDRRDQKARDKRGEAGAPFTFVGGAGEKDSGSGGWFSGGGDGGAGGGDGGGGGG